MSDPVDVFHREWTSWIRNHVIIRFCSYSASVFPVAPAVQEFVVVAVDCCHGLAAGMSAVSTPCALQYSQLCCCFVGYVKCCVSFHQVDQLSCGSRFSLAVGCKFQPCALLDCLVAAVCHLTAGLRLHHRLGLPQLDEQVLAHHAYVGSRVDDCRCSDLFPRFRLFSLFFQCFGG